MTILIIDDDRVYSRAISRHLVGVKKAAETLSEGMEMARRWQPSVILLDVHFPNDDRLGLDVIEGLRVECPRAQIIVMCAVFDREHARVAIERGAFSYLEKGDVAALKGMTELARSCVQTVFVAASSTSH